MKTKNNLTTGILIGIGMIVIPLIIMSSKPISSTNTEIIYGTPESHVWEFHLSDPSAGSSEDGYGGMNGMAFAINKKTGEVRKYESGSSSYQKSPYGGYVVCTSN